MIGKQTEVDLLNHFIRLEADYKVGGTPTKQARVFYCGTVIPILGCFRNHHFSDSKAFEAHWNGGALAHSQFTKKCRGKEGEPCGTVSDKRKRVVESMEE
jgi:hypothetical protein